MEPVALEDFICFDNGLNRLGNFADVGNGDRDVLVVSGDLRRLGILPVSVRDQTLAVGLKQRNGCADGCTVNNGDLVAVRLNGDGLCFRCAVGIGNGSGHVKGRILIFGHFLTVKIDQTLQNTDLAFFIIVRKGDVFGGSVTCLIGLGNIQLACCSVLFNFDRNGELSVVIDDVCNAAVNFLYLIGVGFAVA